MTTVDELTYTEDEIRSFLPTGWNLNEGEGGTWSPKREEWTITVHDEVDFDWPVVVSAEEAEKEGRLEALRRALDRTYRGRLGKRTRGLGL